MEQQNMELQMSADKFVKAMRLKGGYSEGILSIAHKDIVYGLSKEQVLEYMNKFKDEHAALVYSKCLYAGYSKEEIDVITNTKMNWQQMETAFEFYERCVPLETVKQIIDENIPAKRMRESMQEYLNEIDAQKDNIPADYGYVKELLDHVKSALEDVASDKSNYEKLAEKIDQIVTTKKDDEVAKNLVAENNKLASEKEEIEKQLSNIQDDKNQGLKTISELRNEIEEKKEEVKTLAEKLLEAENDIKEKDKIITDFEKLPAGKSVTQDKQSGDDLENKTEPIKKSVIQDSFIREEVVSPKTIPNGIPVYVQVPIMNRGIMVDQVLLDNTKKKSSGVAAILGKLSFKKKSRRDIVRLVASGDLSVAQLEQVCVGIELGLDEVQLEQLINNKLAPERMAKIISIAVMDNEYNEEN